MTGWIGWILFALLLLLYVAGQIFSHRKRLHLRNYVLYLLPDDSIRTDHKAKFQQWVQQSNARDAMQLSSQASNVIERMADALGTGGSTLSAHAMLWNSDAAAELRKKRRG